MVVPATGLFALPSSADRQQLSMLAINPPTAALLLSEYVKLKPGEWVVQNSANSSVGRWVIAFAKARGLKTVNIVRRVELVPELKAIGGDVVVVDSPDVSKEIKAAVGKAELRLALDGVSGPATGVIASTLSAHGTLVIYAAMSQAPMSISPLDVISTLSHMFFALIVAYTRCGPKKFRAMYQSTSSRSVSWTIQLCPGESCRRVTHGRLLP